MSRHSKHLAAYRATCGATLEEWARKIGVHKTTVYRWERSGVPAERVADVETKLGIPRHMIRPDLFAPPGASDIVAIMFDVKEVLTNQQVARQKEEAREKGMKR